MFDNSCSRLSNFVTIVLSLRWFCRQYPPINPVAPSISAFLVVIMRLPVPSFLERNYSSFTNWCHDNILGVRRSDILPFRLILRILLIFSSSTNEVAKFDLLIAPTLHCWCLIDSEYNNSWVLLNHPIPKATTPIKDHCKVPIIRSTPYNSINNLPTITFRG